jgi:hypothetical protein
LFMWKHCLNSLIRSSHYQNHSFLTWTSLGLTWLAIHIQLVGVPADSAPPRRQLSKACVHFSIDLGAHYVAEVSEEPVADRVSAARLSARGWPKRPARMDPNHRLKWFSEGLQTRTPSLKSGGIFWEDAMSRTAIFTFLTWKLWSVIWDVNHSKSSIDNGQTDHASISLYLRMYQLMFPKFMHMLAYSITWSLYSSWTWSFLGFRSLLFLITFKNPMTES